MSSWEPTLTASVETAVTPIATALVNKFAEQMMQTRTMFLKKFAINLVIPEQTFAVAELPQSVLDLDLPPYQHSILERVIKRTEQGFGTILMESKRHDSIISMTCLLSYLKQVRDISGPHLLVVPPATFYLWAGQLRHQNLTFMVFDAPCDSQACEVPCDLLLVASDAFQAQQSELMYASLRA